MLLAHIIHNIDPFFVRFGEWSSIGGIRWYGVCYALSFIIALLMMNMYSDRDRSSLSKDQNISFLSYGIVGVIVGGRLGYALVYNLSESVHNPLSVLRIWEGGMASHGGFIGMAIAMWLFCKVHKVNIFELGDICSSIAPLGLFLGRIANFVNGELYGKISHVPWAIIFPQSAPEMPMIDEIAPRHPSQLYEGFGEGFIMFIYVQLRFWISKNLPKGQLTGEFLVGYSLARIITEIYREIDMSKIFGMSYGQFFSIFLLVAGLMLVYRARKQRRLTVIDS
ncbi:MAG: prolipoprotein diacylglyceryl transferase [Puniceicoccales bacterium]|jgi:phosphatidylglycerol:prolipoprotein diacylglycerol transferase|nr:prolipoprotein diacylglyceryl transferase [Puniceicoccales bacterium]